MIRNISALLGGDKPRLYVGLFDRGKPELSNDMKYHSAFVLVPKRTAHTVYGEDANWYHVRNGIRGRVDAAGNSVGESYWEYRAEKTSLGNLRIHALMFLGKISHPEKMEKLLESVEIKQNDVDPNWRCHDWLWSALDDLVKQGLIEPLPTDAESVWNTAVDFAVKNHVTGDMEYIPTCSTLGQKMKPLKRPEEESVAT